jgi:hypothetical protein
MALDSCGWLPALVFAFSLSSGDPLALAFEHQLSFKLSDRAGSFFTRFFTSFGLWSGNIPAGTPIRYEFAVLMWLLR